MRNFKIIASKANIYTGQVKKLKEQSELPTQVVYIEDLLEDDKIDFENSIVYFLCCNSPLVPSVIPKLKDCNCYVINKEYLEKNYLKLDVQMLLHKNNVSIPQIYSFENINDIKFPVFCKENRHEGIIAQIYNDLTITRLFSKFNSKDFYIEQSIDSKLSNEIKVYYVAGKVFFKDSQSHDEIVNNICKNISVALNNLEVFSADIIKSQDNNYYVIDVNPSAGFYLSDDGRKYFLDELKKR